MSVEDLVKAGLQATQHSNDDDLRDALTHPDLSERKAALMRIISSAWQRGWAECDEEYKAALGLIAPRVRES